MQSRWVFSSNPCILVHYLWKVVISKNRIRSNRANWTYHSEQSVWAHSVFCEGTFSSERNNQLLQLPPFLLRQHSSFLFRIQTTIFALIDTCFDSVWSRMNYRKREGSKRQVWSVTISTASIVNLNDELKSFLTSNSFWYISCLFSASRL